MDKQNKIYYFELLSIKIMSNFGGPLKKNILLATAWQYILKPNVSESIF